MSKPLCTLVSLLVIAVGSPGAVAVDSPSREFLRGVVVSCPRAGQIWGTPTMGETLEELKGLGVEWAAIHPYGWIGRDGTVRGSRDGDSSYLARAAEMAERTGIRLFWKPHLGYWGRFEWRGAIEFGKDEAAWNRFFSDYRAFIVDQARLAEAFGAPLFAVGVELDATVHREKEWREVVTAVRDVYRGEILYAANWDRVGEVPFWDAVDRIGVHAYFPLASTENPSRQELLAAWDGPLRSLEDLSKRHGRSVVVAEIGYNRSPRAALEPWAYETVDSPAARELRSRLFSAAIERLEAAPHVSGMFWWKWMPGLPNDPGDENFSMRDPEARAVLEEYWGTRVRVTAE